MKIKKDRRWYDVSLPILTGAGGQVHILADTRDKDITLDFGKYSITMTQQQAKEFFEGIGMALALTANIEIEV